MTLPSTLNHTKNGGMNMDPATFGIVATGVFGVSLVGVGILGKEYSINEDMIVLVMEILKHGSILYLFKVLYQVFFL